MEHSLAPFYRWENWGPERVNEITKLVNASASDLSQELDSRLRLLTDTSFWFSNSTFFMRYSIDNYEQHSVGLLLRISTIWKMKCRDVTQTGVFPVGGKKQIKIFLTLMSPNINQMLCKISQWQMSTQFHCALQCFLLPCGTCSSITRALWMKCAAWSVCQPRLWLLFYSTVLLTKTMTEWWPGQGTFNSCQSALSTWPSCRWATGRLAWACRAGTAWSRRLHMLFSVKLTPQSPRLITSVLFSLFTPQTMTFKSFIYYTSKQRLTFSSQSHSTPQTQ